MLHDQLSHLLHRPGLEKVAEERRVCRELENAVLLADLFRQLLPTGQKRLHRGMLRLLCVDELPRSTL